MRNMKKLFGELEGNLLINLVKHEIEYEQSQEQPDEDLINAFKSTIEKIRANKGN